MARYNYVNISNGSSNWRIATTFNNQTGSTRNNILNTTSSSFLVSGENDAEAVERTYSDGSVLPPNIRRAGRDFSLTFLIYSEHKTSVNVRSIFQNLESFLNSDRLTITTDYPHNLTVQTQSIEVLNDHTLKTTDIIEFRVFFKAAQP